MALRPTLGRAWKFHPGCVIACQAQCLGPVQATGMAMSLVRAGRSTREMDKKLELLNYVGLQVIEKSGIDCDDIVTIKLQCQLVMVAS